MAEESEAEEPAAEKLATEEPSTETTPATGEETTLAEPPVEEPRVFLKEEINAMYPDRKISFYATWGSKPAAEIGDEITIHAQLSGYEGLEYIIRWQLKHTAQEDWQDMGITGDACTFTLTTENLDWLFRVAVDIMDVE